MTTPSSTVKIPRIRIVDVEGGQYVLRFPYDVEVIAAIKHIPGAKWNPTERVWTAPLTSQRFLTDITKPLGFIMSPAAEAAEPIGQAPTTGRITRVGNRLVLSFPYDFATVAAIKQIRGRTYDAGRKLWTVPISSIRSVRELAADYPFVLAPEVEALPDVEPIMGLEISATSTHFLLDFPLDRYLMSQVKDLPGAKWDAKGSRWIADIEAAVEVAELARKVGAHIAQSAIDVLDSSIVAREMIAMSTAADAEVEVAGLGGVLRPFQRAGVAYALRARRTFIADEPGLGKTVQALAALEATQSYPAVIVVPATLRVTPWLREAKKWLPHRTVSLASGTKAHAVLEPTDITIVNYDVIHAWGKVLGTQELKGLVTDEAHYAKSASTRRGKALIELTDLMDPDGMVLCLTGTPVLNNETEIVSQLRILRRLDEFGGSRGFRARYGHGRNLVELNRKLRATCYIRRLKADVAPELPPKVWSEVAIEGDPKVMIEYREAETNLVAYLSERARKMAIASGATDEEARARAWIAGMRAEAAEHLVAVTALKRLAARAKMEAANEWIGDFLESGKKLVAFGWHRDIVDEIADRFGQGAKIQGGQTQDQRTAIVDRFQDDEDLRVIACQIKAAGVGLTLTAASDVVFLELGWNPGDMDQAADRCHRIGQEDSVTAWTMICQDTIDEDIVQLIADKREVVNAVTDGIASEEEEEKYSVLSDLIVRLTARGMA